MTEFNAEVICTKLFENVKSNQHRIKDLEDTAVTIQDILISLKEIATEMKNMKEAQEEIKRNQEKSQEEFKKSQDELAQQLRDVERKPERESAKKWELISASSISALIGGLVAHFIAKFFS